MLCCADFWIFSRNFISIAFQPCYRFFVQISLAVRCKMLTRLFAVNIIYRLPSHKKTFMPRQFVIVSVDVKRLFPLILEPPAQVSFHLIYRLLLNSVAYKYLTRVQVYFTIKITAEFDAGNLTPAKKR